MIVWDKDGTPISERFDDPYYSKRDGRAETRHVFIDGNNLIERFRHAERFTVAELGFGTGLNFLTTLQTWRKAGGKHLTYISFEQYPLSVDEIRKALSIWSDLESLCNEITPSLPNEEGRHEINFEDASLILMIGDANVRIKEMTEQADAWFLDGFNPSKNPELWNRDLMRQVAARTREGGTFATYTAAGWVRRMMEDVGFAVERVPGYAHKRHMTRGVRGKSC